MLHRWKARIAYEEDPLYFYYEGRFDKTKFHRWMHDRWSRQESDTLRVYKSIVDVVKTQNVEQIKQLPVYYTNTWSYYFALLCQHYSTLRHTKSKEYQFAIHKFQDWVRSSGFIWQYDICQMYDNFSHAIILMEHHGKLDGDIVNQWEWMRWVLFLSGKADETALDKIPKEWWQVSQYPAVPCWNAPLLNNRIIQINLENWMHLLVQKKSPDVCLSILKHVMSPYFVALNTSMTDKQSEVFQWFKSLVRQYGSMQYGEWELYDVHDWAHLSFVQDQGILQEGVLVW